MDKLISNKIKYFYFFFTLGIVIYHARQTGLYRIKYLNIFDNKLYSFYSKFAYHIGIVSMVFFFFISAFWFYRDLNTKEDLIKKWKKRIKTLLIPFTLWTIIIALYKITFLNLSIKPNQIFYYFFEAPIVGPLWYILGILLLQLFAPLIMYLKRYKVVMTILFIIISVYIHLRFFGIVPKALHFKNWWWYECLISYLPIYLLGIYISTYKSELLLNKKYQNKKYAGIGMVLLIISFVCWNWFVTEGFGLTLIYSVLELTGLWFILKPSLFKRKYPKLLDCCFYIYALHSKILIPKTEEIITKLFSGIYINGYGLLAIKLGQVLIIVLISIIIKILANKLLSEKFNYYLTGGR